MAKKRSKRTPVGSPLTPSVLGRIGGLSGFPPAPADFDPAGSWTNTYRIWTCHGYRESGNYDMGSLRIERAAGGPAGTFALRVDQKVVNDEGAVHSTRAEIECHSDRLASPVRWELSSCLVGPDGKPRAGLTTEESCSIDGDAIEVRKGGRLFRRPRRVTSSTEDDAPRKGSESLTGDWCLFEAIGRLPFRKGPALVFDLMEGMSLLKGAHRLSYRGPDTVELKKGRVSMHRFVQIGRGTLPYEYWLDESHRLLVAITLSRAYILDDGAEEKTEPRAKWGRRSYQRKLEASGALSGAGGASGGGGTR